MKTVILHMHTFSDSTTQNYKATHTDTHILSDSLSKRHQLTQIHFKHTKILLTHIQTHTHTDTQCRPPDACLSSTALHSCSPYCQQCSLQPPTLPPRYTVDVCGLCLPVCVRMCACFLRVYA